MSRLQIALDLLQKEARLGLSMPAIRRIAKTLGRNHELALALWDTCILDARIVAGFLADPAILTSNQMDECASSFSSWDVCDQDCGSEFLASPMAWQKRIQIRRSGAHVG